MFGYIEVKWNILFTLTLPVLLHLIFIRFFMWTIFKAFSEFVTNIVSALCFGFLAERKMGA